MKRYLIMILISLLFVGCNNNTNNGNNIKSINNNNIEVNNNTTINNIELSSDDTKIVFKLSNIKYVFYYTDNIITNFHTYINYGSNELAKKALESMQKEENMDNIYIDDKYIVIEWNENSFKDMTLDNVRTAYSYMEEIVK